MLGVERAPIEVVDDGVRHSVRVGDAIDFEIEDIVPFGIETGQPVRFDGMFHPVALEPDDRRGDALEASTRSASPTKGRRGSRRPSSPGLHERRSPPNRTEEPSGRIAAVRLRLGLVALLVALAVARGGGRPREMRGMDGGPVDEPRRVSAGSSASWVVMMAAMMFPSVAPTVALYSRMTQKRSPVPALVFAGGYLVAVGDRRVSPRTARGCRRRASPAACSPGIAPAAGSPGRRSLVAAVYELTPLKDVCLGKCRSPLGFLLGSWRGGVRGALRMGVQQRRLVRRLLLGADGVAVRARRHEPRLDGVRRRR